MSGRRPPIKGYFSVAQIVGAVMVEQCTGFRAQRLRGTPANLSLLAHYRQYLLSGAGEARKMPE